MALLRALRISMNGKKGAFFEAEGNRVKQLTQGENPIAEVVTREQLEAEKAEAEKAEAEKAEAEKAEAEKADPVTEHDPDLDGPIEETKPAAKPSKKGGKKPADAGKAAEVK